MGPDKIWGTVDAPEYSTNVLAQLDSDWNYLE